MAPGAYTIGGGRLRSPACFAPEIPLWAPEQHSVLSHRAVAALTDAGVGGGGDEHGRGVPQFNILSGEGRQVVAARMWNSVRMPN